MSFVGDAACLLLSLLQSLVLLLWSAVQAYPKASLVLLLLFMAFSHVYGSIWYLRFMGSNTARSLGLSLRHRRRYSLLISCLDWLGFLISFPMWTSRWLTHYALYGPVRNIFISCRSHDDAYRRAKVAGGGREPISHPPHRPDGRPHFHVSQHEFVHRNGVRENLHFQY